MGVSFYSILDFDLSSPMALVLREEIKVLMSLRAAMLWFLWRGNPLPKATYSARYLTLITFDS
jgi:hypothetical protein